MHDPILFESDPFLSKLYFFHNHIVSQSRQDILGKQTISLNKIEGNWIAKGFKEKAKDKKRPYSIVPLANLF